MAQGHEPPRSAEEGWVLPDPLTLSDTFERGTRLALEAQQRWVAHCGEIGQSMSVFAMRRVSDGVSVAQALAASPTPAAAVELYGRFCADAASDLAEEMSRCGHALSAAVDDAAEAMKAETDLAVASTHTPDIPGSD